MRLDQRERVRPHAQARRRHVAAGAEARLAAEDMPAFRGPERGPPPHRSVEKRCQHEDHARAPRQAPVEQAPAGEGEHAESAGPRSGQHDDVDEDDREGGGDAIVERLRLAQPDGADHRPQQQAAEVVRLAQVAGRATDERGERHPVAVGGTRREHLHDADQRAGDAGDDQADAEGAECETGQAGALCRRRDRDHQHGGQDRSHRRERERRRHRIEDRRRDGAERRQRHRGEQRQRAARARPGRAPQARREHDQEAAPADQGGCLVEERRGRRDVSSASTSSS
jgi:hypothetical protein